MSLADWPARAGTVALLWLALVQSPLAAVSIEDVSGDSLDSVTVGLFVDGLRLDSVPGGFILEAILSFDSNLTLTGVATGPDVTLGPGDIFWAFQTGPNVVAFNAAYENDPGPFMNAEMLSLTFLIGDTAGPGPFVYTIGATQSYDGASIVPLPPALLLCTGALAALSMFRRRV